MANKQNEVEQNDNIPRILSAAPPTRRGFLRRLLEGGTLGLISLPGAVLVAQEPSPSAQGKGKFKGKFKGNFRHKFKGKFDPEFKARLQAKLQAKFQGKFKGKLKGKFGNLQGKFKGKSEHRVGKQRGWLPQHEE